MASAVSIMSKEGAPLQYDLFTRELVDNRTRTQKQVDRQHEQPQQTELFSQREIAQFGVRARPQMSVSPFTKLVLIREDPRTPEEIERDLMRQAEEMTCPLFADTGQPSGEKTADIAVQEQEIPDEAQVSPNGAPDRAILYLRTPRIIGYRLQQRRESVKVRRRGL